MNQVFYEGNALGALPDDDVGRVISLCLRLLSSGGYSSHVSDVELEAEGRACSLSSDIAAASEDDVRCVLPAILKASRALGDLVRVQPAAAAPALQGDSEAVTANSSPGAAAIHQPAAALSASVLQRSGTKHSVERLRSLQPAQQQQPAERLSPTTEGPASITDGVSTNARAVCGPASRYRLAPSSRSVDGDQLRSATEPVTTAEAPFAGANPTFTLPNGPRNSPPVAAEASSAAKALESLITVGVAPAADTCAAAVEKADTSEDEDPPTSVEEVDYTPSAGMDTADLNSSQSPVSQSGASSPGDKPNSVQIAASADAGNSQEAHPEGDNCRRSSLRTRRSGSSRHHKGGSPSDRQRRHRDEDALSAPGDISRPGVKRKRRSRSRGHSKGRSRGRRRINNRSRSTSWNRSRRRRRSSRGDGWGVRSLSPSRARGLIGSGGGSGTGGGSSLVPSPWLLGSCGSGGLMPAAGGTVTAAWSPGPSCHIHRGVDDSSGGTGLGRSGNCPEVQVDYGVSQVALESSDIAPRDRSRSRSPLPQISKRFRVGKPWYLDPTRPGLEGHKSSKAPVVRAPEGQTNTASLHVPIGSLNSTEAEAGHGSRGGSSRVPTEPRSREFRALPGHPNSNSRYTSIACLDSAGMEVRSGHLNENNPELDADSKKPAQSEAKNRKPSRSRHRSPSDKPVSVAKHRDSKSRRRSSSRSKRRSSSDHRKASSAEGRSHGRSRCRRRSSRSRRRSPSDCRRRSDSRVRSGPETQHRDLSSCQHPLPLGGQNPTEMQAGSVSQLLAHGDPSRSRIGLASSAHPGPIDVVTGGFPVPLASPLIDREALRHAAAQRLAACSAHLGGSLQQRAIDHHGQQQQQLQQLQQQQQHLTEQHHASHSRPHTDAAGHIFGPTSPQILTPGSLRADSSAQAAVPLPYSERHRHRKDARERRSSRDEGKRRRHHSSKATPNAASTEAAIRPSSKGGSPKEHPLNRGLQEQALGHRQHLQDFSSCHADSYNDRSQQRSFLQPAASLAQRLDEDNRTPAVDRLSPLPPDCAGSPNTAFPGDVHRGLVTATAKNIAGGTVMEVASNGKGTMDAAAQRQHTVPARPQAPLQVGSVRAREQLRSSVSAVGSHEASKGRRGGHGSRERLAAPGPSAPRTSRSGGSTRRAASPQLPKEHLVAGDRLEDDNRRGGGILKMTSQKSHQEHNPRSACAERVAALFCEGAAKAMRADTRRVRGRGMSPVAHLQRMPPAHRGGNAQGQRAPPHPQGDTNPSDTPRNAAIIEEDATKLPNFAAKDTRLGTEGAQQMNTDATAELDTTIMAAVTAVFSDQSTSSVQAESVATAADAWPECRDGEAIAGAHISSQSRWPASETSDALQAGTLRDVTSDTVPREATGNGAAPSRSRKHSWARQNSTAVSGAPHHPGVFPNEGLVAAEQTPQQAREEQQEQEQPLVMDQQYAGERQPEALPQQGSVTAEQQQQHQAESQQVEERPKRLHQRQVVAQELSHLHQQSPVHARQPEQQHQQAQPDRLQSVDLESEGAARGDNIGGRGAAFLGEANLSDDLTNDLEGRVTRTHQGRNGSHNPPQQLNGRPNDKS